MIINSALNPGSSARNNIMENKIEVIRHSGIIDGISGNEIREQAIQLLNKGKKIILVDCQDISFMNSAGIGALVAALKAINNEGGEFYLCSLSSQVKIIFKMTKMNRIFQIFASREEFQEKVREKL